MKKNENNNLTNIGLVPVSFQFLYRKKRIQEDAKEFYSKKKTLEEAMDDFLTKKRNIADIDEEVEITYENGNQEMVQVDARQNWDLSWYFVIDNRMIFGNGRSC